MLSLACVFQVSPALALDAARPLAEFTLTTWTRADGLPHGFIIDLEQSSEGYIWAATWRGAARFNGREFRIFDQAQLPWNEDGSVWKIARARDGGLLLGSQRFGLSRLRDGRWMRAWQPEPGTTLLSVVEDTAGRVWVGTREGVFRIDAAAVRKFSVQDGMPDGTALSMSEASDGAIWIGTSDGVARIDGEAVTAFGVEQGLPRGEIGMVLATADGAVRVGTKRGVYRLEGARFVAELPELPADEVTALLLDRDGALWIGTVGHGVFRATSRGIEQLGIDQGLPSAHVNTLLEDVQGNLWIGTHGGLSQLRAARFALYSAQAGLADDFVRAIVEDDAGDRWIATNGGVSRIRDGRIESLASGHPDASLSTLSLLARRNGEVWMGTYRDGIRVLAGGHMRALGRSEGLAGEEVRSMIEAADGSIWIGTASGLTRLRGDAATSWERIGEEPSQLYVRVLLEHSSGRIYLGMPNGLASTDGEDIVRLRPPGGQAPNVFGLHECTHGHLWVLGSGGLWRLRDGQWARLDSRHDLGRHTVFSMQSDGQGNDWFSTVQGLVAVDHAALERAIDDPKASLAEVRYADGPGSEGFSLNGGSTPSSLRTRDGRIWLASGQGAVVFDPQSLDHPVAAPPTVIERILVDGADRDALAASELAPGTRRIEFRYAGLSFLAQESIRYRHRLIGFDDDWSEVGGATAVSYTNLPPEDYRFEVEALVEGAVEAPRRAVHAFRVQPYLYERIEFQFGLAVLIACLAIVWFRRRTRALRERTAELQRLVDDRTRELSARGDRLEQADREKAELIARLEAQSLQLARHAREDGLTGLANRRELDRSLQEALDQARHAGQPLCLALVDIDHFKRINDDWGHGTGDEVLRGIAEAIRDEVRAPATAGRYGGEEFGLILPGMSIEDARALCDTLRRRVAGTISDLGSGPGDDAGSGPASSIAGSVQARARPAPSVPTAERIPTVTVSIGIADVSMIEQAAQAYDEADRHLYAAKRGGRNRVAG